MLSAILTHSAGHGHRSSRHHVPVLLREAIAALNVQPGGRYIDCTLGSGGHALAILEASSPGGQLLGIDANPAAIVEAQSRLAAHRKDIRLVNDNFVHLRDICYKYEFYPVSGILFDLGLSSRQLEAEDAGFSFQREAPLDMRFGLNQQLTAYDIVNAYTESQLTDIIREYGEDPHARQIARQIVAQRPLHTTFDLVKAVLRATGRPSTRIHPATRTFQAIRIAVNSELVNLSSALVQAIDLLGFGGRLAVISYHSLEDRIVKDLFRQESTGCICPPSVLRCMCGHAPRLRLISKKAIRPSPIEVRANPRSRSAKLRAAERILKLSNGPQG
ncbi:MAG: 16S rRNA (cytosine(1402)-N(4))-methyltransferase RsmH [Chloroflexi bacterium]|nr:16S rRNA (cytosine(1402)-N(4))-methyltransferase RsmH [Chloroflexota bacterium]